MWDYLPFWLLMVPFWYPNLWCTKRSPWQKAKIENKECYVWRGNSYWKIFFHEHILLYHGQKWNWRTFHRFNIQKTTNRKYLDHVSPNWNALNDQPNVNCFSVKLFGYGHFSKYYCYFKPDNLVKQQHLSNFQ